MFLRAKPLHNSLCADRTETVYKAYLKRTSFLKTKKRKNFLQIFQLIPCFFSQIRNLKRRKQEKILLLFSLIFYSKRRKKSEKKEKRNKRKGKRGEKGKVIYSFYLLSQKEKRRKKEGNDPFFSLQNERKMEKEREKIRVFKVMKKKKTLSTDLVNKV